MSSTCEATFGDSPSGGGVPSFLNDHTSTRGSAFINDLNAPILPPILIDADDVFLLRNPRVLSICVQRCEWKAWKILSGISQIVSYGCRAVSPSRSSHVQAPGGARKVASCAGRQTSGETASFVAVAAR